MIHVGPDERRRALSMLLLANFFWGSSFAIQKAILLLNAKLIPGVSSWFSTLYTLAPRFLLAATILLLLRPRACWSARRGEWKQGAILGLFSAGGVLFQIDGLQFTEASTSAFLTQFYAILIPVWVAWRSRQNPGARVWTSCALVLAGVAILGRFDWTHWSFGRGEWETLVSSLFFMGQILTLERKEFVDNRPTQITFAMFATQALAFAGLACVTAPSAAALVVPWTSLPWVGLALVLASFCTCGAYLLMNTWQPKITATEAGLIYCVEPIFGSLLALFLPAAFSLWAGINYPNEVATWTLLVGGSLITLANVLLQSKPPPKE